MITWAEGGPWSWIWEKMTGLSRSIWVFKALNCSETVVTHMLLKQRNRWVQLIQWWPKIPLISAPLTKTDDFYSFRASHSWGKLLVTALQWKLHKSGLWVSHTHVHLTVCVGSLWLQRQKWMHLSTDSSSWSTEIKYTAITLSSKNM